MINIEIRNKIATIKSIDNLVASNSGYVVHFDFDEEFAQYEYKTARFVWDNIEYTDVVFSGNEVEMPIKEASAALIGVYCGELKTTTPAALTINKSILGYGGIEAAPTEDVYAQIMEALNDAVMKSRDVIYTILDGQGQPIVEQLDEDKVIALQCLLDFAQLLEQELTGYVNKQTDVIYNIEDAESEEQVVSLGALFQSLQTLGEVLQDLRTRKQENADRKNAIDSSWSDELLKLYYPSLYCVKSLLQPKVHYIERVLEQETVLVNITKIDGENFKTKKFKVFADLPRLSANAAPKVLALGAGSQYITLTKAHNNFTTTAAHNLFYFEGEVVTDGTYGIVTGRQCGGSVAEANTFDSDTGVNNVFIAYKPSKVLHDTTFVNGITSVGFMLGAGSLPVGTKVIFVIEEAE